MRKHLYIARIVLFLAIGITFNSCQKTTGIEIPLEKSFVEPDSLLVRYQKIIEATPYGFEYTWDAKGRGFYAGFLEFTAADQVSFMMDALPRNYELSFSLNKTKNKPTLSLKEGVAHPDLQAIWGKLDSSFSILNTSGDTLLLRGNKYGNLLKLVPITQLEKQAYLDGGMQQQEKTIHALQKLPKYFKRLFYNGGYYDVYLNPAWRKIYIHYGLVDRFRIFECSYAYSADGIQLQEIFTDDGNSFSSLAIRLDTITKALQATINGRNVPFSNEASPSALDLQAALQFYNNPNNRFNLNLGNNTVFSQAYSTSRKGFTVAGEEDAYQITQIPSYAFLSLFHSWLNNPYGGMRLFDTGSILSAYGPAFTAQYISSLGLLKFNKYGEFGQVPVELKTKLDPTFEGILNTNGFYVIKSGPASYDLVTYDQNPQKWIRFE